MTTENSARRPEVRKIQGRLGALRARIRAIFATIGISRWVVAAVGLLALFFLADWLLDLPIGVRRFIRLGLLQPPSDMSVFVLVPLLAASIFLAIGLTRRGHRAAPLLAFFAAGLVGLLAWFGIRMLFPMRVRLPDQELALSVESKFRHLKDRLAAALDFERELQNPSRGESAGMMSAVIEDAAQEVRDLRFSKAVSGARAFRWAGAATVAVALAGILAFAFKDTVGLWAQRSLLLSDVPWPRATTMHAVDLVDDEWQIHDPQTPYFVPIGRSFTVYAKAQGEVPDGALVLDLVAGQDPLARRMFTVPGAEGLFAYEFRDVRRPFSFFVRGGDDDDDRPVYDVDITIPPRVLDIESTIAFPDYLERQPETVPDGSVSVPEGSRVSVSFRADVEIAEAEAVFGEETLAVSRSGSGADAQFAFSYDAMQSGPLRLVMRTPDGKLNDPSADTYEVRVKLDQAPRLEWIYPRISVEVTPNGRVPLLARASDDHGVTRLALDVRVGGEEAIRYELQPYDPTDPGEEAGPPLAVNDGPYGRRRVLTYLPVEIASLRDTEGAALVAPAAASFRLVAFDSRGQSRESDWARVDVGDPAGLERGLATQRANVRLALEAVRRDQQGRRDEVATLLEGPLGRAELDLLKTIRFGQSKIAQDADRAMQELFGVFNAFVLDRLGSANPNAKILGYIDRHHRETYGLPEAADGTRRAAGVAKEWKGDPVFPYKLYRDIVAGWRSKEIYDRGLLDKMCAVIEHAERIGSRLAPSAHAAAAKAVSGATGDLKALLAAQDANLAALDDMLAAMRGWQSLSDVTLFLRGIIDAQEALMIQIEDESKNK